MKRLNKLFGGLAITVGLLLSNVAQADTLVASQNFVAPNCSWVQVVFIRGVTVQALFCDNRSTNVGRIFSAGTCSMVDNVPDNAYRLEGSSCANFRVYEIN